jgi:hypothetical protein
LLLLTITLLGCPRPETIMGMGTLVNPASFDVGGAEGAWAPAPGADLLPLGVWVRVGDVEAFTYVDEEAGSSVRWDDAEGSHVRRIQLEPPGMQVMDRSDSPPWLEAYGPQPIRGTRWGAWRDDPRLAGRFHPEFPDDLRVVVGDTLDGSSVWEVVWVSLRSCDDLGCRGALLNQPDRVRLTRHQQVAFRFEHLVQGGLPPAAAVGAAPSSDLLALAASERMGAMQQDDPAWEVDLDVPPAERLVPMSQWVAVGDQLAFVVLGALGPEALLFGEGGVVSRQSLTWRTRQMRVLTEAELADLGVPDTPLQDPSGQPPPGAWGEWRLDPRLRPLLQDAYPDVLLVHLIGLPGEGGQLATELVRVTVRGCEDDLCTGLLLESPERVPGHEIGDEVRFSLDAIEAGAPLVIGVDQPAPERSR